MDDNLDSKRDQTELEDKKAVIASGPPSFEQRLTAAEDALTSLLLEEQE